MKRCGLLRTVSTCHLAICVATALIMFIFVATRYCPYKKPQINAFTKYSSSISSSLYGCILPTVNRDDSTMKTKYPPQPENLCPNIEEDWVKCQNSTCWIRAEAVLKNGNITCSFQEILRKSDDEIGYGKIVETSSSYVLESSDFVEAVCKALNGKRWSGVLTGVRVLKNLELLGDHLDKPNRTNIVVRPFLNVVLIGLGPMSKIEFAENLPLTHAYLTEELGAAVLTGYQSASDWSSSALLSFIVQEYEQDFMKYEKNPLTLVWENYKEEGYITAFNEMSACSGTKNKVAQQPTDHYFNTFCSCLAAFELQDINGCIRGTPKHRVMLDYMKKLMLSYESSPIFALNIFDNADVSTGIIDRDIVLWLDDLSNKNALDNTILIITSDIGIQPKEASKTLQGKLEARMPFVSFRFPKNFLSRFPIEYDRFQENIEKLTTPYDIYETLLEIIQIQQYTAARFNDLDPFRSDKRKKLPAGISLFQHIPTERSCRTANIPMHLCVCLSLEQPKANVSYPELTKQTVKAVQEKINNITQESREVCAELENGFVEWWMKLTPNYEFLKFRISDIQTDDYDLYQAQILFGRFNMLYEVLVWYSYSQNKVKLSSNDIVRINRNDRRSCWKNISHNLLQYCYCK